MRRLYQCGTDHYVVAMDYGDAERTVKDKYGWATEIKEITNLGPYVLISSKVLESEGGEDGK